MRGEWNHDTIPCSPRHPPRLRLPTMPNAKLASRSLQVSLGGILGGDGMLQQQKMEQRRETHPPGSAVAPPPTRQSLSSRGATSGPSQPLPPQLSSGPQVENRIARRGRLEGESQPSHPAYGTVRVVDDFGAGWEARGALSARMAVTKSEHAGALTARRRRGRPQPLTARERTASPRHAPRHSSLPPPPSAAPAPAALAAAALSQAEAAAAAAGKDLDLHAAAAAQGYLNIAAESKPGLRPPPGRGAAGALILTDAQIMEQKERELEAWLKKFVKANGLQQLYESEPDPQFEQALIKDDIELNTASIKLGVRTELESHRLQAKHEQTVKKRIAGVSSRASAVSGYAGRSSSMKMNREAAFEKQGARVSSSLAASLAAEYESAKLESKRELQVEEIQSNQRHLKAKFDEEYDVDLAKALMVPQQSGSKGTRHSLATMESVSGKFVDGASSNPLQNKLKWAMRGQREPALAMSALNEDSEDAGGAIMPPLPKSPPLTARALHSGHAHLPRTPEGAPPIPGLWPRPRSRALSGSSTDQPLSPRTPGALLQPLQGDQPSPSYMHLGVGIRTPGSAGDGKGPRSAGPGGQKLQAAGQYDQLVLDDTAPGATEFGARPLTSESSGGTYSDRANTPFRCSLSGVGSRGSGTSASRKASGQTTAPLEDSSIKFKKPAKLSGVASAAEVPTPTEGSFKRENSVVLADSALLSPLQEISNSPFRRRDAPWI